MDLSRASVLETVLTAQTRLVLQTAIFRRQKRRTQTDTKTSTPCNGVLNTEQGGVSYKPTAGTSAVSGASLPEVREFKRTDQAPEWTTAAVFPTNTLRGRAPTGPS